MSFKDFLIGLLDQQNLRQRVFKLLSYVLAVAGFFIVLGILFPTVVTILMNILWVSLLVVVIVFCGLGVLVIFGMKKDVNRILSILLEGSLTIIDFINFVKNAWEIFKRNLRDFLIYSAPVLANITGAIIYIFILILYKAVGKYYDVTILTIAITVGTMLLAELLNRHRVEEGIEPLRWVDIFKKKFQNSLSDAFEVVLFVFFLTMDSTNLFFLPANLNIPIHADLFGYNFITRGFVFNDHRIRWTLTLIMIAIISEIIRYVLKIARISYNLYSESIEHTTNMDGVRVPVRIHRTALLKDSIRRGFVCSQNDTVKFITFNTFLILVFLLFPRLKLLALAVGSLTSLILNIFAPRPRISTQQTDLLSRILAKTFSLN